MNTILITPICPHNLTFRPLVVPDNQVVRAELISKEADVFLTIDGQVGFGLRQGDVIEVKITDLDDQGRYKLSRKAVLLKDQPMPEETGEHRPPHRRPDHGRGPSDKHRGHHRH